MKKFILITCSLATLFTSVFAQTPNSKQYYFSWGYNRDYYFLPVNIHVDQPNLNSDYKFLAVHGQDKKECLHFWDYALTIPQYNIRLGFIKNDKYLFEMNFDHTKFVASPDQQLHLKGKVNGRQVDTTLANSDQVLKYQLNNGANFYLLMAGRKYTVKPLSKGKFAVDGIVKAGGGFVYPHVENTILGHANKPHFQMGGFNLGIEATVRLTFNNFIYLEPACKLDYARYWGLRIYEGKASQSLNTLEGIASIGILIPKIHGKKATVAAPAPPAVPATPKRP